MLLDTERLIIRTLRAEDAPLLRAFYLGNRAFFAPWDPEREDSFYEEPALAETIAADAREREERRSLKLYLFEKPEEPGTSPIVGYAGLSNIVYGAFLSGFLGYKVDEAHRGMGYMTEAIRALVEIAFIEYGLHRVEANIMPRNAPSVRLARALGFQLEGSSPKYLRIAGAWEDHDHYVLRNAALE